jgi:DNA-binding response OmpR family regulator
MTGKQILIVEDDAAIMETLTIFLSYEGFRVLKAQNIKQAFNLIETTKPDLVLLDYMLQDDTAEPIVDFLRKRHPERIPILLLTAAEDPEGKRMLVDADAVIPKPFDLDLLLQHIVH